MGPGKMQDGILPKIVSSFPCKPEKRRVSGERLLTERKCNGIIILLGVLAGFGRDAHFVSGKIPARRTFLRRMGTFWRNIPKADIRARGRWQCCTNTLASRPEKASFFALLRLINRRNKENKPDLNGNIPPALQFYTCNIAKRWYNEAYPTIPKGKTRNIRRKRK